MSRPGGPHRDEQYPRQPQGDHQRGYPQQQQQPAYDPRYDQGYAGGGYPSQDHQRGYGDPVTRQPPRRPTPERQAPPGRQAPPPGRQAPSPREQAPPPREPDGGGFRLPGLGLLLSLLGLVVQVVSFTVLPWVYSSANKDSQALPAIWDLATNFDAHGFSGAYVVLFSYPLAVLGILLSLVAVIESVAMKVIWAALTIIGIGVLALRFGPFGDLLSGGSVNFSRQEITFAVIALAALVVVIFMLKMAMSTFRRLAGLVLLVIAGVHVAAVSNLTDGFAVEDIQPGAYGPALGYALAAAAAFIGPKPPT
ncbi:MAG: hypothetical protein WBA97_28715 [Actinophytocola sp.]|uniref:hypothetical protein n=1 Tax=Actinophytocola sp. TaxID=1872138 RepID=UPI003C724193